MDIVLAILLIAASVCLVLFVVLQTGGKSSKLSQAIAGGSSDNYGDKNKARAKDKYYSKLTTICAIAFAVIVLITAIYTNHLVKNADNGDSTTEITTDAGTGEDTAAETGDATGSADATGEATDAESGNATGEDTAAETAGADDTGAAE